MLRVACGVMRVACLVYVVLSVPLIVCVFVCSLVCLFVCMLACVRDRFTTLRVPRAETRLTVYRSSYIIPVQCYSARRSPPRFSMTIDKSCITKAIIMIVLH